MSNDVKDVLSGKVFPVACTAFQILREGHVHRCGGINCAGVLHECYVCREFFSIPGDLRAVKTPPNPLLTNGYVDPCPDDWDTDDD